MRRYININLFWLVPASLAIIALFGVSAKANYDFGLSLGHPLFGYASLASDVTKIVALFAVFSAWYHRRYIASFALLLIWAACTVWSVGSAFGFMSLHYADMTDRRGKTAEDYQLLSTQLTRFEQQLGRVGTSRPQSVIQSEIDGLYRIPGVDGCSVINGPVTRQVCPKIDTLKAELGNAKSFEWLTGRIDELRRELKGTDRVTSIDPRADTLASLLGITIVDVKKGIVIFFALLLEFVTAVGLWAVHHAYAGHIKPRTEAKESTATTVANLPKEPPAKRSELVPSITLPSFPPEGGSKQKKLDPEPPQIEEEDRKLSIAWDRDAPTALWRIDKEPPAKQSRQRSQETSVTRWLRNFEVTELGRGDRGFYARDFYQNYKRFCDSKGESAFHLKRFSRLLRGELDLGKGDKHPTKGQRFDVKLVPALSRVA